MIEIDPASPTPLYLQIAEQVRRLIALGALRPGDRLPAVRELAARARVNRNTAARAVQVLEAGGLVRTRVGQGTFIEEPPEPVDRAQRESAVDERIDRLLVEAHTLGMPLEELGWRLSRRIDRFRRSQSDEASAPRAGGNRSENE
jgi:GntR family transcriptional regulator